MGTVKYEDIVSIPKFLGINQSGDGYNTDMKYAYNGKGFDTRLGDLTPWHKPVTVDIESEMLPPKSGNPTLAFLTKRWTMGASGAIASDIKSNKYCFAVSNGYIYWMRSSNDGTGEPFYGVQWNKLKNADNTDFRFPAISADTYDDKFDTLTYELNYCPPVAASTVTNITDGTWYFFERGSFKYKLIYKNEEDKTVYKNYGDTETEIQSTDKVRQSYAAPVDCILMTNSDYGMYCIYVPLESTAVPKIQRVVVMPYGTSTDIKFGCIERYCERVFGSGMATDSDKIMYSAPFDIFNWEQDTTTPDDGAGDVQQPEWDGDRFVSLKVLSSSLLCIKKHSIWKISGDYPSQFVFSKMYGEGTISDGSVAVHGYYCYFLANDGLKTFDGTGTNYLKYGWVNPLIGEKSFAENYGDFYVIKPDASMPDIILYNTVEGTFNQINEDNISTFKTYDDTLYALVSTNTGMHLSRMLDPSGTQHDITWESAWIDIGAKNITKSGFSVYMLLDDDSEPETPVIIPAKITLQSEKKTKEKQVNFTLNKPKKININCSGRLYKLKISIPSCDYTWHMRAGIQIYLEYDYD